MIPNLSALATNDEPAEPRAVAPTGKVLGIVQHTKPHDTITAEATLMICTRVPTQSFKWSQAQLRYSYDVRMESCADAFPRSSFTNEQQPFEFYQRLFDTVFQINGNAMTYSLWTAGQFRNGQGYILAKFMKPTPTYESVQIAYANNIESNLDAQLQWRAPSGPATSYIPVTYGDKDNKGNDMLTKIFGYISQAYKLFNDRANAPGPFLFVVPDSGTYVQQANFYSLLDIQSRNPNNFT